MATAEAITFARLSDGTLLRRQPDGTFRPVASGTDRAGLAALADADIERMAASDPDHPGFDDAFWDSIAAPDSEQETVALDSDVVRFFRREGSAYQARINAVLRRYMQARRNAS